MMTIIATFSLITCRKSKIRHSRWLKRNNASWMTLGFHSFTKLCSKESKWRVTSSTTKCCKHTLSSSKSLSNETKQSRKPSHSYIRRKKVQSQLKIDFCELLKRMRQRLIFLKPRQTIQSSITKNCFLNIKLI
jgi:hypothetical protein